MMRTLTVVPLALTLGLIASALGAARLDHAQLWALILVTAVLLIAPLISDFHNGKFDLFNLRNAFLLFLFMQFVVWPISASTGVYQAEPFFPFPITFMDLRYRACVQGMYAVVLGILAFHTGYYFKVLPLRNRPPRLPRVWSSGRLVACAAGLTAIGMVGFFFLTRDLGFWYFVTHIDKFRNTGLLGIGYLMAMISTMAVASGALTCHYYENRSLPWFVYSYSAVVVAVLLLGASRHAAVTAIVFWLVARHYMFKRFHLSGRTVALVLILWVLNVSYIYFRRYGGFSELSGVTAGRVLFLTIPRFTGSESLARVVDFTQVQGFHGGEHLLSDLVFGWVPRVLWPGKPLSAGLVANTTFFPEAFRGGETGAAVPTLIGELYWIGGIWAVLGGMWCLGRFCRDCYRRLEHGTDANAVFLYGLQFMFAFFVNETLSLHLSRYLFQLVVASVLLKLVQARRARSRTLRWQILTLPAPGLAHARGTCATTISPTGE